MAQVNDLLVLGKANFLNEITSSQLLRAFGGVALDSSTEQSTSLEYVLGIKPFASGGNVMWSSVSDFANVMRLNASGTWGININGTAAKSTYATLTDISANGTYYLVSTGGTSGNQSLYAEGDTYYYYASSYSSLNVGKNTKNGIFTLHNSDHIANLQSATLTSDVSHTFPATGGTVLNTGTTSWTAADTTTAKIGTLKLNGSNKVLYDMFMYQRGNELAEATDLNTLKTPSVYHSPDSARSTTLVNTPWKSSGYRVITMTGYSGTSTYGWQLVPASQHIFWRLLGSSNNNPSDWYSWVKFKYGTKVGDTNLPIYLTAEGVPTAVTASSLFSAFSSSTNTLSITVAGQTRTASAVNSVSNTWTGGTTSGPTITTTVNGIAGTAQAIPSASTTASGVVTTGSQRFRGTKTLEYPIISSNNTRYQGFYYRNNAGTTVGEHWYDTGDATKITTGKYYWRQYSPKATADTATTGYHETYSLPTVTAGLTANASYEIFTSKSYTTLDGRYVNVSGDTMTGLLTLSTGDKKGIKLGAAYMTTASTTNGEFVLQGGHLRFGGSAWDYNVWAGLKYDSTNKVIYLGLADGSIFTANAAQSGGTLALPGVAYLSINGKRVIQASDSWLRINDGGAHTSGIYFGTSTTRTDGRLEVGSGGAKFYAASDGTGYFDNDIKVKGHVFAYNYNRDGNDAPAFVFDKNGSNYTGIGSHNLTDTIWFGAVNATTFAWVTDYYQNWYFNGNVEAAKQFRRVGISSSWYNGRDNAVLRMTTSSGYSVLASMKTTNGTWDIGNYNSSSWHDILLFNYKSDTSYASGSSDNTVVHAAKLSNAGYLTLLSGLSATSGTFSEKITLSGTTAGTSQIYFGRGNASYFMSAAGGYYCFIPNGQETGTANADLIVSDGAVYPGTNNVTTLGKSSYRWSTVYTNRIIAAATADAAHDAANGVALITGDSAGTHLEFDGNEIFAKTSGTAAGTLYLQSGSGNVEIASGGQTTIGTKSVFKNDAAGGFNFAGRIDVGCLLLTNTGWTGYGTGDPSGVTAVKGRVYFKLI